MWKCRVRVERTDRRRLAIGNEPKKAEEMNGRKTWTIDKHERLLSDVEYFAYLAGRSVR